MDVKWKVESCRWHDVIILHVTQNIKIKSPKGVMQTHLARNLRLYKLYALSASYLRPPSSRI